MDHQRWYIHTCTYIHRLYKQIYTDSLPHNENTLSQKWLTTTMSVTNYSFYLWLLTIVLSEACFEEILPEGVYRTNTGNFVNDTAMFACQDGFTYVRGNESRECYINGSWSGEMFNCTS